MQAPATKDQATDENTDEKSPKADTDVIHGDLVVGVTKIVKQQAEGQVRQGVAHLVHQYECQDETGAWSLQKLTERPLDGAPRGPEITPLCHNLSPSWLAETQCRQHRWQRKCGTDHVCRGPTFTRRYQQGDGTRRRGANAPTILRHAGADTELVRLQSLDAIRVDNDIVSGSGDAE